MSTCLSISKYTRTTWYRLPQTGKWSLAIQDIALCSTKSSPKTTLITHEQFHPSKQIKLLNESQSKTHSYTNKYPSFQLIASLPTLKFQSNHLSFCLSWTLLQLIKFSQPTPSQPLTIHNSKRRLSIMKWANSYLEPLETIIKTSRISAKLSKLQLRTEGPNKAVRWSVTYSILGWENL